MKSIFSSNAPSGLDLLREDVRKLGRDAAQVGRQQVLTPAMNMAHEAQQAFEQGLSSARKNFGPRLEHTRQILEEDMAKAQKAASRQYDRAWSWISANPFTALGIALAAGFVLNSLGRRKD